MANKKILILTPDGVGSTLLQRAACAYGNLKEIWINPHELTNGLTNKNGWLQKDWSLSYTQSLNEISNLILHEKNNMIVRLAHYHILKRKDSPIEAHNFYAALNENFEIISCHRRNIIEYAMSWAIRDLKNTLNVYSYDEKKKVHPANDSFELNEKFIIKKLNDYLNYERWLFDNFNIKHKFYYENILSIDEFFASNLFNQGERFENQFGISLKDYCLLSNKHKDQLNTINKQELKSLIKLKIYFDKLVHLGYMPNTLPLKMNSFSTKIRKTKNFNSVLQTYNQWTKTTNEHKELTQEDIDNLINTDPFNEF